MQSTSESSAQTDNGQGLTFEGLLATVAHHWGYHSLRPLQAEAMKAVLQRRDSLVVLPTGGGKSLCYQAPAVYQGGTTVVVSPLIALMKDQVDGLQRLGLPAVQIDSSLSPEERWFYERELLAGKLRLVFVSPERLVNTDFYKLLQRIEIRSFAIDEAHCISHWGHDFRPEYRQLARLRELFPDTSFHAYTATATAKVRQDIIVQLQLRDPAVLVGNFDRPNLTYRILPRHDVHRQVLEVLDRHQGEAGIVYCLRRQDVDELTVFLKQKGCKVMAYHAGLTPEQRKVCSEAFAREEIDVVVATVAFGMGVDRSNVRFVLHTAMPKSLEHYQQETGRAGRDGLEAECVLLYSGADFLTLRHMIEKSAEEAGAEPAFVTASLAQVDGMDRFCRGAVCRHKALVNYFGQPYEAPGCNACDLCLGDTQEVPEATVVAQKILSCVARVKQMFGIGQVAGILRGENTESIRSRGHDKLSTFGLLKGVDKAVLRDWIYQLIGQGVLVQTEDEYPKLRLNDASWEVMRGQRAVRLIQLIRRKKGEKVRASAAEEANWEGVDRSLFEKLKELRKKIMVERGLRAAYHVFNDATLRDMARIRPTTLEKMHLISGVGATRLSEFGQDFLDAICQHCRQFSVAQDIPAARPATPVLTVPVMTVARPQGNPDSKAAQARRAAFALFREGKSLDEAVQALARSRGTVVEYLVDYILMEQPRSIRPWVPDDLYQRVAMAARQIGTDRLRPLYVALGEKVAYDSIRLVVAHLTSQSPAM